LLRRQVLTPRFRSELGLEAITPMAITDRIRTMATTMGLHTGTAAIATTATIAIITTSGTKLT
jgi:hypothetical protein